MYSSLAHDALPVGDHLTRYLWCYSGIRDNMPSYHMYILKRIHMFFNQYDIHVHLTPLIQTHTHTRNNTIVCRSTPCYVQWSPWVSSCHTCHCSPLLQIFTIAFPHSDPFRQLSVGFPLYQKGLALSQSPQILDLSMNSNRTAYHDTTLTLYARRR